MWRRKRLSFSASRWWKPRGTAVFYCWTGVVQITEADEFVYQEMISHVPLIHHGSARRVLIIGAGDGGVLRRVLQHSTVEHATMVGNRRGGHPPVEGLLTQHRG